MVKWLLISILLFASIYAHCQISDSTETPDTVVIYKAPLIISKKVFIEEEQPTKSLQYSLDFSAGIGIPKYKTNLLPNSTSYSISFIEKKYYNVGIGIIRDFHNFSFKLGLALLYGRDQFKFGGYTTTKYLIPFIENDTLDSYIVRIPNTSKDTTVHIIEQVQKSRTETYHQPNNISLSNKTIYLELPITGKYLALKNKISIYLTGSFIPGLLLKSDVHIIKVDSSDNALVYKANSKILTLSYNVGMEVSYPITEVTQIYFAPTYRNDLSSVVSKNSDLQIKRELIQFNIGVKFYFR